MLVPGGAGSTEALAADAAAVLFVREASKHCTAIGASGTCLDLLDAAGLDAADLVTRREGLDPRLAAAFVQAIARHRDRSREAKGQTIPA